jgi:hypothetical protein
VNGASTRTAATRERPVPAVGQVVKVDFVCGGRIARLPVEIVALDGNRAIGKLKADCGRDDLQFGALVSVEARADRVARAGFYWCGRRWQERRNAASVESAEP